MINDLKPLIGKLTVFAKSRFGFKQPPRLFLKKDSSNSKCMLGKTAHYDPADRAVTVFVAGRHPKDILRSYTHELVHHCQNERGDLSPEKMKTLNNNYAQENEHMRKMEEEAYLQGNMCFRDWEDSLDDKLQYKMQIAEQKFLKESKKMSVKITKKQLKELIEEMLETRFVNESPMHDHGDDDEPAKEPSTTNKDDDDGDEPGEHDEDYQQSKDEPDEEPKNGVAEGHCSGASPGMRDEAGKKGKKKVNKMEEGEACETHQVVGCQTCLVVTEEADEDSDESAEGGKLGDGKIDGSDSVKAGLDNKSSVGRGDVAAEAGARGNKKKDNKKKQQESKIHTPEQEKALYESRFTQRNTRLFEKLLKEWTK